MLHSPPDRTTRVSCGDSRQAPLASRGGRSRSRDCAAWEIPPPYSALATTASRDVVAETSGVVVVAETSGAMDAAPKRMERRPLTITTRRIDSLISATDAGGRDFAGASAATPR